MLNNLKKNFHIYLLIFLYLSLVTGLFFNEDSTGGGLLDYYFVKSIVNNFSNNFKEYFFTYENRHSPIFYIFLSLLKKMSLSFDIIRFIYINFAIMIIYFFYKCLKINFSNVSNILLITLSGSILLSPNFRTFSIWLQPIITGILLLVLAIYYYIKFLKSDNKKNKFKYALINTVFTAISAYISPNYSIFFIYFIFNFLFYFKFSKEFFIIIALNLILSLPALYYFIVLEMYQNFFSTVSSYGKTGIAFNFSNKIIIISSIILFHLFPIIIGKGIKIDLNFFKKNLPLTLISFIIFLFLISKFNFEPVFGGGGIFFKASNFLINNNYILYLFSLIGFLVIIQMSYKNFNNFLLFLILIFINPQLSIYHKYYDPLILILIFTLFSTNINKLYLSKKFNIGLIYIFNSIFLILNFLEPYLVQ